MSYAAFNCTNQAKNGYLSISRTPSLAKRTGSSLLEKKLETQQLVQNMRSMYKSCDSSGILHQYFPVQSFIELGEVQ